MNSKEQMDRNMYNASIHIVEAARYMSDVDKAFATNLMRIADRILAIVDAPQEKVDPERMTDILAEILNAER